MKAPHYGGSPLRRLLVKKAPHGGGFSCPPVPLFSGPISIHTNWSTSPLQRVLYIESYSPLHREYFSTESTSSLHRVLLLYREYLFSTESNLKRECFYSTESTSPLHRVLYRESSSPLPRVLLLYREYFSTTEYFLEWSERWEENFVLLLIYITIIHSS